jgi:hypothetical protein
VNFTAKEDYGLRAVLDLAAQGRFGRRSDPDP